MNRRFLFIILLLAAGINTLSFGQIKKIKKQMELYNYSDAVSGIEKSLQKGKNDTVELTLLMAECYRKQNDVQHAREWYKKALNLGTTDTSACFYYAQALRSCGEYDEARTFFLKYLTLVPGDTVSEIMAEYCQLAEGWLISPPAFEIKSATSLNSNESEFGPVFYDDRLWFTSDRPFSKQNQKSYGWTGNDYLHLYFSVPVSVNDLYQGFTRVELAPGLFNKDYHDGPASFSPGSSEVLFNRTLAARDSPKMEINKIRTHLLRIYRSELKGSRWMKAEPFFLNSNEYSVGHPAFSKDGNVLYFVSDMEGGYGGTDLYMCRRTDSSWSQPVNLGPAINTFGNDMFPFEAGNGELYLASDGHPGFGGLDLFVSRMEDSTWLTPQNLGVHVNTSYDDFSLYISNDGQQGIFSSNRPGGAGSDDLYLFRRLPEPVPPPPPVFPPILAGYVKNKKSLRPVLNATVFLCSQQTSQVLILKTDSNGYYRTDIPPGETFTAKAMCTGFIADCFLFSPILTSYVLEHMAPRDLLIDMLVNNQTFALENIYYDLNKSDIRDDAKPSLDNLVTIMKENPVNVELGSYTDCRASDAYNLQLSQKRAESAVAYIVSQGINPDRIIAQGYGETQLINKCKDGIPCSEPEHQQNRRTEFKVVSTFDDLNAETFDLLRYRNGEIIDASSLPEEFFDICK